MNTLTEALILITFGAVVTVPLILLNIRVAPALGLIDWPKARGIAEEQVPIVGHSLVLLAVISMLVFNQLYGLSPWLITTALLMGVMGYLDDRKPLPALDKMFFQLLCVSAMIFLDPQIYTAIGAKYGPWGSFLAGFFIVGLMNAVNFIDGIDGLAGIVIVVGSLAYMLFQEMSPTNYPGFALASIMAGSMIPFLYFNVRLRKGFLGNVGSYFFSYVLAVLHVSLPMASPDPISRLSISGLCFLIPIADSLMVIIVRLATMRSPFQPDKGHLHHRLIQTSMPLRWILLNFAFIELGALLVSVQMERSGASAGRLLPFFTCLSHIAITSMLILLIEKASRRRIQVYFQRLDAGEPIFYLKYRFSHPDGSHISPAILRRIEARVSAEIRVTDLCFLNLPNELFVTLRTMPEPLKGISSRLDTIFQNEHVHPNLVVEQGEFVKVSQPARTVTAPAAKIARRKT